MSEFQLSDYRVAPMTADDTEAVTRMRLKSWMDTYVNDAAGVTREWIEERIAVQLTPEKEKARKENLQKPGVAGWVARDDKGEVIGGAIAHVDEAGGQHLGSLYVDRSWHGAGVAQYLMREVIDWSDASKPLQLGVATYNERAKAFYRRWGFEEVPGSETLFAEKIPEIMMVRKGDDEHEV